MSLHISELEAALSASLIGHLRQDLTRSNSIVSCTDVTRLKAYSAADLYINRTDSHGPVLGGHQQSIHAAKSGPSSHSVRPSASSPSDISLQSC